MTKPANKRFEPTAQKLRYWVPSALCAPAPTVDGRKIFNVNPDKEAALNYEFVLRHGHAELINTRFSQEHI